MGANIARRLGDVGYDVSVVHDTRPEVARELARELNATAASSLHEVSSLADVVITVVSDDAAMRAIFATKGDSLLTGAAGKTFVNCATVTPRVHVEVEQLANERGAATLEACMASSIPQARNGTLYLMVGGDERVFTRLRPMLERMSSSLRYVGPIGSAAKVKALVNMVMNINTAGLAEGLALGSALGINLDELREIFARTGAASRVLLSDGEDMQKREHTTFFSAEHARKDSAIALALGQEKGLELPLAAATKTQYDLMCDVGLGHIDKSGISELTFGPRRARYSVSGEKAVAAAPK